MRKRKEIEHSYKAPISCSPRGFEEIKIELLLDIRECLLKLFDAEELMKKEISQIASQKIDPRVLKKL